jgi:hypothetical protein
VGCWCRIPGFFHWTNSGYGIGGSNVGETLGPVKRRHASLAWEFGILSNSISLPLFPHDDDDPPFVPCCFLLHSKLLMLE